MNGRAPVRLSSIWGYSDSKARPGAADRALARRCSASRARKPRRRRARGLPQYAIEDKGLAFVLHYRGAAPRRRALAQAASARDRSIEPRRSGSSRAPHGLGSVAARRPGKGAVVSRLLRGAGACGARFRSTSATTCRTSRRSRRASRRHGDGRAGSPRHARADTAGGRERCPRVPRAARSRPSDDPPRSSRSVLRRVGYLIRIANQKAHARSRELASGVAECSDASIFHHTFQSARSASLPDGRLLERLRAVGAGLGQPRRAGRAAGVARRPRLRDARRNALRPAPAPRGLRGRITAGAAQQTAFEPFYFCESVGDRDAARRAGLDAGGIPRRASTA